MFGYAILFSFHQEYFVFMIFFSPLVFFLLFELLCPVPLPCLMPDLLLITSFPQNKRINVTHIKVCVLETSFPVFFMIDSVLMDLSSISHFPCALHQPCFFLPDIPCSLFSQDVPWLISPDLHYCCPASSVMSDSSVAYLTPIF